MQPGAPPAPLAPPAAPGGAGAPRVGVLLPTYNRPDLARACVLQLAAQSRPPDLVCVHQNGHPQPYAWAVADLQLPFRIVWLHSPQRLPEAAWYAVPLRWLLAQGCSHYFWIDHDDLYLREHVQAGLAELAQHDCSVARRVGLLYTRPGQWHHEPVTEFGSHAPGGMSGSLCFTRPFAQQLLADLEDPGAVALHADEVLARQTMPRFRCLVSLERRTCIYHAHPGSSTSAGWLDRVLGPASP